MSNPEFEPIDMSTANNRLHPDIPVEEPPYDSDMPRGLDPSIPIQELPYPEEDETSIAEQVKSDELPIDYVREPIVPVPHTFEDHCALLDAAIQKAIDGDYANNPKVKVRGEYRTIPHYLATIVGGSRSGLTPEERRRINELYIGPWTSSTEHSSMDSKNTAEQTKPEPANPGIGTVAVGTALGVPEVVDPVHPHVVTNVDDEGPYERAQRLRQASWEERIAP